MSKFRHKTLQFNVLDALSYSTLPRDQLIRSVSSYLLGDISRNPAYVDNARAISQLLASDEGEVVSLTKRIVEEMQRQLDIKILRTRARWGGTTDLMGSQLRKSERIYRVCRSIFGDPSTWKRLHSAPGRVRAPTYYWLHKDSHGAKIAGFDGLVIDVVVSGFVVKDGPRARAKVFLLPFHAKTAKELMLLLGVDATLHETPSARIDWARLGLRLPGNKDLPWVYP